MTAQGKPRAESYVFAEGQYFGGKTSDTSLARTEFNEIIQVLAPPLAKQNYFPTKEVKDANLLLMVHWGTTRIFEDPLKESLVENTNRAFNEYRAVAEPKGIADPSVLNTAILDQRYESAGVHGAIARNAALLGYKTTLQREQHKLFPSPEEQTINEELREERYFIIVMAFDYQLLRKEKKSRLLWITRMSVRSPGNKFEQAIPAIAQAGAEVYGRHVDGLVRVKANARGGQVYLGDLKTVGPDHGAVPGAADK